MLPLIVLLCLALPLLFMYYSSLFRYWDQRGVKSLKGSPTFDFLKLPAIRRKCKVKRMKRLYDSFRGETAYGRFSFASPVLVIRDLDLAKKVIVRDCCNFTDRNANLRLAFCPVVRKSLYNTSGGCWKSLRFRLTPVFASAKTSGMYGLIQRTSLRFRDFLKTPAMKGDVVPVDKVVYRFNADLVADAVFGVDGNCLSDPDSKFLVYAKILADHFFVTDGCSTSLVACVAQLFHPYDVKSAEKFFLSAVEAAIQKDHQQVSEGCCCDKTFVQLLLEASRNAKDVSAEWINVQACSFVVLGLRSLTLLLTACLVELARHKDVQSRLRQEIREAQRAHGSKDLPQSEVHKMTFMDRVIAETLRKWPPVIELVRETTQACTLPGTSLHLEAHTKVTVPVFAIHRDPDHFPDPERFDPDRFNDDANFQRHSCGYLPFGDGPRNCIGMRFALVSAKACLTAILSELEFQTCDVDSSLGLDSFSYPEGKTARLRVSICP